MKLEQSSNTNNQSEFTNCPHRSLELNMMEVRRRNHKSIKHIIANGVLFAGFFFIWDMIVQGSIPLNIMIHQSYFISLM